MSPQSILYPQQTNKLHTNTNTPAICQVLDIVRAAESLALGTHLPGDATGAPPKSPIEHHEDKMHKTTTIVMSAHTLDTQPQVCATSISTTPN